MAVLELRNRLPASDAVDRAYFSDRVRQAALRELPELRLMTRENMEVIAKAAGVDLAECEGECEVVTGRKLGADTIVSGEISRIGSTYKLTLRMHATREGRLLSVGQAGGRTLEDLDRDLDQATGELLQPLTGGARRPPATVRAVRPPPPLLRWMFQRDMGELTAGWNGSPGLGNGLHVELRAFGLEAHLTQYATGDNLAGIINTGGHWKFAGYAVGISPLSFGTGRDEPGAVTFTFLEPFALYRFGTVKSDSTLVFADFTQTAIQVGNHFLLDFALGSNVALRLGLDLYWDQLVDDGGHPPGGTAGHFGGFGHGGVAFGNP
jgi:hypothetical protein